MPRKSRKTQKPPLLFLEQSLDGARHPSEPEVRPQFDTSHLTALPARRGRRKGHSTTSILDRSSQLSESRKLRLKTSICKFPTLSFERGPTQPSKLNGQPKPTRGKKSKKVSVAAQASTNRQQPQQQTSRPSSLPSQQTPKRRTRGTSNVSTSSSVSSERPQSLGPHAATSPPRAVTVETPSAGSCIISSPPDVETPEGLPQGRSDPSPRVYPLLGPLSQPQSQPQPETLVADTPERDYGLRVTWRRRKGLMMALEKGGHLSKESLYHYAVLLPSSLVLNVRWSHSEARQRAASQKVLPAGRAVMTSDLYHPITNGYYKLDKNHLLGTCRPEDNIES
ncbi:RAD9, HUS1, RAD1-interacting nuclear orphan protein 1 [Merluccius polli]|uniref:RAD9, HUS1, RAD1-interacting nuclear orphan protein 1 n=1 Tax=Merluccius polli TaxID=89951 RepID=A0AA47MCN7_MERPO|nr:RAD9, HUS1, RAD1-interacting nuclear orphan protein 1 [Merluccius polli]